MSNEEHGTVTTSDEPSTATCPVMSAQQLRLLGSRPTSTGGRTA